MEMEITQIENAHLVLFDGVGYEDFIDPDDPYPPTVRVWETVSSEGATLIATLSSEYTTGVTVFSATRAEKGDSWFELNDENPLANYSDPDHRRAVDRYFEQIVELPREVLGIFILPSGEVEIHLPKGGITPEAAAVFEGAILGINTIMEEYGEG